MGTRAMVWAVTAGKVTAGDVIEVIPDNKSFSASDKAADYSYIIHLPDMPYDKARQLLEPSFRPAVEGDLEFDAPDPEDRFVREHKKRWRLKVEGLGVTTSKEFFKAGSNIDSDIECKEGVKDFSTTEKYIKSVKTAKTAR